MMSEESQFTVPPGFRFHPTDEELLYYYLRKKVSYEAIELDVIREVDLNKLEPWDLKEKCRIGGSPQNEWYFFSHKDKKYPTGTRTNRATVAGFWKATGRDKAIHLTDATRIGMRKTLVFYTGRAPHGQKTDWIMHEYRLEDDYSDVQEDGWVVCRVFKKKMQSRGMMMETSHNDLEVEQFSNPIHGHKGLGWAQPQGQGQAQQVQLIHYTGVDSSMHLPQLFSPEINQTSSLFSSLPSSCEEMERSQNLLMRLSRSCVGGGQQQQQAQDSIEGGSDWSFLDKLLASHNHYNVQSHNKISNSFSLPLSAPAYIGTSDQKFPFSTLGCENDFLKFSK